MTVLKEGWGNIGTVDLLKSLSRNYGDKAIATAREFFEAHLVREWAEIGKKEARAGTEIDDFIRVLWDTLTPARGYRFTIDRKKDKAVFRVLQCPVHEPAEKSGLTDWLYALGCTMDYLTTREFSPGMGFSRTKTLIQGHDCCDHTYYSREAI